MDALTVLAAFAGMYAIIAGRYALMAGSAHFLLWRPGAVQRRTRPLTDRGPQWSLVRREMSWSLLSSVIYAGVGLGLFYAWEAGVTRIYTGWRMIDWVYMPLSIALYLFLHDTYFYWTHRAMHHRRLFASVHRVHHQSRQPTPWASFSFNLKESLIEAPFLPLLVFLVPIHMGALLFVLTLMTVSAVLNHAGREVFPEGFLKGPVGRHLITATHHNHHHHHFGVNFGLYFRFWDRWMGTDADGKAS